MQDSPRTGIGNAAPRPVAIGEMSCRALIERCYDEGWTDGLPVVPPDEVGVRAFLDECGWDPDEIVLFEPVRGVSVHAGAVVVNAVMAGCRPEHLPVVHAALRAMGHDDFRVHIASSSTGGPGPVVVVNGPIREQIDLNCGVNVFGSGRRANAVIGRALRLVLWNCLGARSGELDNATMGWFGKYSACFGEREEVSPWPALHVRRGFAPDVSTVTVLACESPHAILTASGVDADAVLFTAGDVLAALGSHSDGQGFVVIGPEHAHILGRAGYTIPALQQHLFHASRRTLADLKRGGRLEGAIDPGDEIAMRPRGCVPDDLLVLVAGGDAGASSAWFPSWSRGRGSVAVTAPIDPAGGAPVSSVPGPGDAPGLGDGRPRERSEPG
jgi:hypothetical protein